MHVQFPDAFAARSAFRDRWQAFITETWRDPVQVAAVFSVSEKTARQWWVGETCPQGWAVSFATETLGMVIPFGGRQ